MLLCFTVPEVSRTPPERIVYVSPSHTNFELSVDVTSPEAATLSAQWRMNGVAISPDLDNYIVTAQGRLFSLMIVTMVTPGTYELLVTGQAGTAVSATWQLKQPGESCCLCVLLSMSCDMHGHPLC